MVKRTTISIAINSTNNDARQGRQYLTKYFDQGRGVSIKTQFTENELDNNMGKGKSTLVFGYFIHLI